MRVRIGFLPVLLVSGGAHAGLPGWLSLGPCDVSITILGNEVLKNFDSIFATAATRQHVALTAFAVVLGGISILY